MERGWVGRGGRITGWGFRMMWLALGLFVPVVVVLGVAKAPGQVIVPALILLLTLFLAGLVVVFVGFGVGIGVRSAPPPGTVTPAAVEMEARAAETRAAGRGPSLRWRLPSWPGSSSGRRASHPRGGDEPRRQLDGVGGCRAVLGGVRRRAGWRDLDAVRRPSPPGRRVAHRRRSGMMAQASSAGRSTWGVWPQAGDQLQAGAGLVSTSSAPATTVRPSSDLRPPPGWRAGHGCLCFRDRQRARHQRRTCPQRAALPLHLRDEHVGVARLRRAPAAERPAAQLPEAREQAAFVRQVVVAVPGDDGRPVAVPAEDERVAPRGGAVDADE
jgi:hypothetical protein